MPESSLMNYEHTISNRLFTFVCLDWFNTLKRTERRAGGQTHTSNRPGDIYQAEILTLFVTIAQPVKHIVCSFSVMPILFCVSVVITAFTWRNF